MVEFQKGKSIFEYMAYFEGVHFENIIQQVQHGEVVSFDQEYRTNRMSTWIRYTLTPVYEEKTLSGLCITGRDITAKKKYVQTIERQNRILREISWMQSHLVRAPLARIMGLTDLLKTLAGNEQERKEIVQFLEASSGDLDAVLRDIVLKSSVVDELSEMNDER